MATLNRFSISDAMTAARKTEDVRFLRVASPNRREVLALLMTGRADGSDPAVDQFLDFARERHLDLTELWAAKKHDRWLAAALLVPAAGASAMLFESPVPGRSSIDLHSRLIERLCEAQDQAQLRMVQCLLDPPQTLEKRALAGAKFDPLATLVYMQCGVERTHEHAKLGDPALQIYHWAEAHRARFADAIEASYVDTRDCPALLGIRTIDQVIAGHMATGRFDPNLWYAFYRDDQPVGVLLLSELPEQRALELVYVGVTVPWRGRGLGRRMARLALDIAARHHAASVVLAVDEKNEPALSLYRDLTFRPTDRKIAMIRKL